ncbi:hypothetical protein VME0621_03875 [Vibrio mediterranei]|uniref:hypothetical protein n=1 Tax=Vibrio mediterranei TaxID=689 RepID=UPI000781010B|nr:hypothetical protein [Vibrio mediterranei]SBO11739.1 hypothetical protein VME0621_03875 [Vibrio mediterranei]
MNLDILEGNRSRFIKVIKELALEFGVTAEAMVILLSASLNDYEPIEDFPNYEKHKVTGVIRNRNTRRILKANANGQVGLFNGAMRKFVKQGLEAKGGK